ncbi:uncharacterized protein LOC124414199 [Diprion similis]|uniref:uncharacterized protein LOC124414199 n=1 Tax=Diprion similis TaxID=362088 RepID=UPI001EF8920E|nr:uncharacterized protein LOC124414199 [Diprion similis]
MYRYSLLAHSSTPLINCMQSSQILYTQRLDISSATSGSCRKVRNPNSATTAIMRTRPSVDKSWLGVCYVDTVTGLNIENCVRFSRRFSISSLTLYRTMIGWQALGTVNCILLTIWKPSLEKKCQLNLNMIYKTQESFDFGESGIFDVELLSSIKLYTPNFQVLIKILMQHRTKVKMDETRLNLATSMHHCK